MRRTLLTLSLAVLTLIALQPGTARAAEKTARVTGTVTSLTMTSITIGGGAGGGAKFSRTFAVDSDTKVIAKGASTASAAMGGRTSITDIVANGDRVTITYHRMGEMNHAAEVRVTAKSMMKK